MSNESKQEYLLSIKQRYKKSSKKEKQKILDEFCSTCNYNRKYAIRILNNNEEKKVRKKVHVLISMVLILVIILFNSLFKDVSVIWELFKAAGYTYGPLLGLFAFGILTKSQIKDKYVWIIAVIAPIVSFIINQYSVVLLNGYQIGFEILIINGLITFLGLVLIRRQQN